MIDSMSNDEYIAKLEKILEQEKSREDNDIELDFDTEIQKQQKEIQLLEEEIKSLKSKNEDSKIIDLSNFILNDNFINILQKALIEDLTPKINNYFDKYDKEIEGKINKMRDNINEESQKIINDQFNKVLDEMKKNNENLSDYYLNNQKKIINIINKMQQELEIDIQPQREVEKQPADRKSKNSSKNSKEINENNKNQNQIINNNIINTNLSGEISNNLNNSSKNVKNKEQNKNIKTKNNNEFNNSNNKDNNYNKAPMDRNSNIKNKGKENIKSNKPEFNDNKNKDNNISQFPNENIEEDNDISLNDSVNNSNNVFKHSNNYFVKRVGQMNNNQVKNNPKQDKNYLNFDKNNKNPIALKVQNINKFINNTNNDNFKDIKKYISIAKEDKIARKPTKRAAYNSVQKIFYFDKQLQHIKPQKINEQEKEILERELMKEIKENNSFLKNYCLNFIEVNIIPLFKRNLTDEYREILKYNIETILQLCGKEKNFYSNFYYPETKAKKVYDRNKSIEALRRFRKEFGVSEKDFADEGIIQRLNENDLDIYKTFQKIFGI